MSWDRVITEFRNQVWAVQAGTFTAMLELMEKWKRGERFSPEEIGVRIQHANYGKNRVAGEGRELVMLSAGGGSRGGGRNASGTVALIPIVGIISNRASMFSDISAEGGTSVERLTSQFRSALANPSVKAIVFDVDSPGGSVGGVFELADEIYQARGRKKIISVSNTLAASAAYAISAAASDFVICRSGMAGSIGVFATHEDHSQELAKQGVKVSLISAGKFKTEASPFEPLADEARANLQSQVDDFYKLFIRAVALYRADSQQNVRAGYGEGRVVTADRAVRANLADRIATLDDVLEQLGVNRLRGSSPPILESGNADYSSAIARRRRQLALSAASATPVRDVDDDEDEDDEDSACGCACEACKGCTGDPRARAGDALSCMCGCEACKACENKRGARGASKLAIARRQLELDGAALGIKPRSCRSLSEDQRRLSLLRLRHQLDL